jgi:hypothetical protein
MCHPRASSSVAAPSTVSPQPEPGTSRRVGSTYSSTREPARALQREGAVGNGALQQIITGGTSSVLLFHPRCSRCDACAAFTSCCCQLSVASRRRPSRREHVGSSMEFGVLLQPPYGCRALPSYGRLSERVGDRMSASSVRPGGVQGAGEKKERPAQTRQAPAS